MNRGFPTRREAASHSFYRSDNQSEIIGCAIAVNQRTNQRHGIIAKTLSSLCLLFDFQIPRPSVLKLSYLLRLPLHTRSHYLRHMPDPSSAPFNCPNCGAKYEVIRVEAPPRPTTDREIYCVSCGGPLHGRQGVFVLKYFLIERPRRRA